jgi:membrane-associated protein
MWEDLLANLVNLVGAFTPNIALVLFLICFIGEGFIISIPLALDLIWLTAGYHFANGTLPFLDLVGLMLVAMVGRQAGALILYYLSHKGTKFFSKFIAQRVPKKLTGNDTPISLLNRIDAISAFAVAAGRLLWLRIPLTMLLGARGRLKTLMLGIALSSIVYETLYIGLGAVVGVTADPSPGYAIPYFIGALAILYGLVFGIRWLIKKIRRRLAARSAVKHETNGRGEMGPGGTKELEQ